MDHDFNAGAVVAFLILIVGVLICFIFFGPQMMGLETPTKQPEKIKGGEEMKTAEEKPVKGQVVLKAHTYEEQSRSMRVIFQKKDMRYINTSRPEGVTAPDEPDQQWGRLVLGEKTYLVCIGRKGENFTRLYLDRNNNKNLAEETPVETRDGQGFVLEDVPAVFKFQDTLLELSMKLLIIPAHAQILPVLTVYAGKIKIRDEELELSWIPGQELHIQRPGRSPANNLFIGGEKLSVDITIKDNKPLANYSLEKDDSLAAVESPDNIYAAMAINNKTGVTLSLPKEKEIYLPKGKHTQVVVFIRKKIESLEHMMSITLTGSKSEVKEDGIRMNGVEPIILSPSISNKKGEVSVNILIHSAESKDIKIYTPERELVLPRLSIKDPEGNEVASYEYKPG